ncbi:hypothetical protein GLOIN_2v1557577, partial [Rhizophagus irregularis DAOM 181602=DAOM 197198]
MLFNSDKFINLKAPLLKLIIERDDLILEEIDVWNSLLKWGLAQNPTISQDSTKWNDEEIKIIERTLHGFIPLVRFYYMSPEDFLDKIFPLKELLPKDLLNNLLTFHITPSRRANVNIPPSRQLKVDSAIIKPKNIAIFAGWIDKREYTHYIPYSFIFSFTDRNDLQTAKVGYINHGHYSNAIYCHQSNGPTFGN